jgi:flagellar biosynthesis/type III secretory pathway M-ring protein FliF/YscJ
MAFLNDTSLTDIAFSNGLQTVGSGAFLGCTSLKSVVLPKSISKIDKYAFGYNSNKDGSAAVLQKNFKMSVYSDTAAEKYAKSNKISYEASDYSLRKIAFIVICVAILLAAVVAAIIIIRKSAKKNLPATDQIPKDSTDDSDNSYASILGDDSDDDVYIADNSSETQQSSSDNSQEVSTDTSDTPSDNSQDNSSDNN